MSITIYIEGGGNSKELKARCREGFRKLFEKCEFNKKMPKLIACGSRGAAFKNFNIKFKNTNQSDSIFLLVDSEDPVKDIEKPWEHLTDQDHWEKPKHATDENVFLMTTCMETWIACDQDTLEKHYGSKLQKLALPDLSDMEKRRRDDVQRALTKATQNCKNKYEKGKQSFLVLAKINPEIIIQYLPSFVRMLRMLKSTVG